MEDIKELFEDLRKSDPSFPFQTAEEFKAFLEDCSYEYEVYA